uniref:VTT domain-containing protein n=1 Tax=Wuchereria bancrofti TaxID=6293 RepID=A0A1I8EGS2_WUCBA
RRDTVTFHTGETFIYFITYITNTFHRTPNIVADMAFSKFVFPTCILFMIFLILFTLYINFPELADDERVDFKLPKDLTQAKRLGLVLSKYKDKHYYTVLFGISTVYIMLQSLAIPGSIFLTVLSGYLFPFPIALCLVCTISDFDSLFYFIIFLRITPVLPNWLINLASPIFDVPVSAFFFGTFLGVAPPSCIYIQAGATLQKLTHVGAAWSWNAILLVAFTALLSLVPIFYKRINKNDGIFNKSKNIKNS